MAGLNHKHGQITLYLIAVIPFLLSVVFRAVGATPQHVTEAPDLPGLAFNQYLVNLGRVELRNEHFARYVFHNTSSSAVTIKELRPSCGCLNPRLQKKLFQPGESGEFILRVQAATEQPGSKEYYCDVTYEDTKPRETRVTFKLILPEKKISVQPKSLVFYQPSSEATIREITVTDYRNGRLELLAVESSSKLAHVALGETQIDRHGTRHNKVQVTVTDVPPGVHHCWIKIFTDDPDSAELRVPIRLVGPESHGNDVATDPRHDHNTRR